MKSFTVKLPKQNIDPKGSIKDMILRAAAEKLPFAKWYGIHTQEDPEFSISYAGPEDSLCFGTNRLAEFSALNRKYYRPNSPCEALYSCPFANRLFNLREYHADSELDIALERLHKYATFMKNYKKDRGYDFMYYGKPVRIYQKFIQIGNTIIPIDNPMPIMNDNKVINIIINISKTEIINKIINKL